MAMSQTSIQKDLFSKLFSVVTLITAGLFFAGWIYRWAYYGYFKLDSESLSFSLNSFIILPIQVFFGNSTATLQTLGLLISIAVLIGGAIWLLQKVEKPIEKQLAADENHPLIPPPSRRQRSRLAHFYDRLRSSNLLRFSTFSWFESFLNEAIAIGIILACLFWFAQFRGTTDARRDAYHCTSTLPAVTFILPANKNGLAYQFSTLNPTKGFSTMGTQNPESFSIIGDLQLFQAMQGTTLNSAAPGVFPRVWRLLARGNGWAYLFQTLDKEGHQNDLRPAILGIRESFGDQMMILRPEQPGDQC